MGNDMMYNFKVVIPLDKMARRKVFEKLGYFCCIDVDDEMKDKKYGFFAISENDAVWWGKSCYDEFIKCDYKELSISEFLNLEIIDEDDE